MKTTPIYGLPYIEAGDLVSSAPAQFKTMAEGAEVLEANQSLMAVYVMKDPALMHFAKCLRPYWRGILSRVRWTMPTGLVEGINNRIKVTKRIAYGYRDDAYFFLKIRAAFPGVG